MRLVVLTYNILHSHGAARLKQAGRGPGLWALDRLRRVAEVVERHSPDIACLQEVDQVAESELARALGDDYTCAAVLRNEALPPQDGCAIYIRKARFEVLRSHGFRLRECAPQHLPGLTAAASTSGMAAALWRALYEKLNMAVMLRLRPRADATAPADWAAMPAAEPGEAEQPTGSLGPEISVATTHLYWDPRYPDLKLLQAFLLARELDIFSLDSPAILAGDLNSTPRLQDSEMRLQKAAAGVAGGALSGVYALLTQGVVSPRHPHHPVTLRPASGVLKGVTATDVPELKSTRFRSCYTEAAGAEGPITNASSEFTGCLDYIFYRPGGRSQDVSDGSATPSDTTLQLASVRPLPSEEALRGQLPLPSSEHPSDHLPLVAEFNFG